jgi:hypothetical protein
MMKEKRLLASSIRKRMTRVSKEVQKLIDEGLDPGSAASSTNWSVSKDSYVHVIFTCDMMILRIVIDDFLLAEVKRGAKRPGVRKADLKALEKLVKEGPALLVDGLSKAIETIFNCGNVYEDIVALAWAHMKLAEKRSFYA